MGDTRETAQSGEAEGAARRDAEGTGASQLHSRETEGGRNIPDKQSARGESIDGFFIPVPEPVRPPGRVKPDPTIFTLDYAFRKIGGRFAAIELARLGCASDPRLEQLVSNWDALEAGSQKHSPKLLEKLCIQHGLDPAEFLGICTAIGHRFQFDMSSLLSSVQFEEVLEAGVNRAKQPDGTADRRMIYEHKGFLPQKGPGVAIQFNQNLGQQAATLPDFKTLAEIALQASAQAQLPAASAAVVEGEIVEDGTDSAV